MSSTWYRQLWRRWCAALLLLSAFAQAQTGGAPPQSAPLAPPGTLQSTAEVVQAIDTATQELMVAADLLRSKEVANALRRAAVDRSVTIFMVAPPENITDPSSYFVSLAFADIAVRLVSFEGSFLVIDRTVLIEGPLIAGVKQLPRAQVAPTRLSQDVAEVSSFVESFYRSFSAAQPYSTETFLEALDLEAETETPDSEEQP